jgi:ribonuclease P protein subunit POP4
MITFDNITRHEFIGLNVQIADSTNDQIIGLNGTIINETKSMFTLNTARGLKFIPKGCNSWKIDLCDQKIIVNGSKIQKRPFDRIGGKK